MSPARSSNVPSVSRRTTSVAAADCPLIRRSTTVSANASGPASALAAALAASRARAMHARRRMAFNRLAASTPSRSRLYRSFPATDTGLLPRAQPQPSHSRGRCCCRRRSSAAWRRAIHKPCRPLRCGCRCPPRRRRSDARARGAAPAFVAVIASLPSASRRACHASCGSAAASGATNTGRLSRNATCSPLKSGLAACGTSCSVTSIRQFAGRVGVATQRHAHQLRAARRQREDRRGNQEVTRRVEGVLPLRL